MYHGWTPTPELNVVKYRQTLCEFIVLQPDNQYWKNLLDAVDAEYAPSEMAMLMAQEDERREMLDHENELRHG